MIIQSVQFLHYEFSSVDTYAEIWKGKQKPSTVDRLVVHTFMT